MTDIISPPTLEEIEKLHGPVPKPGRALTPEEQAQAAARPPPKPKYYRKGERWARERLANALGAELKKNSDELKGYEKDGEVFYYRTSDGVDYSGRALLQWGGRVRATPIEMEVKTFEDAFVLDNLERQYKALDQARKSALTMVCLVERQGSTIVRGWYIPWRRPGDPHRSKLIQGLGIMDYADLVQALQDRAQGNYKGKSFRHQDHDLLADHAVEKIGGRWVLCRWLQGLCPWPEEQESAF